MIQLQKLIREWTETHPMTKLGTINMWKRKLKTGNETFIILTTTK